MKTCKPIKAFTLSELIVVLILTSIVVGLAFSVLGLVQKQILAIRNNYNQQSHIRQLETSLWIDMHRYSNLKYDATEESLVMTNELDSVTYQFTEEAIIKDQDTFKLKLSAKEFYFDGKLTEDQYINALKITTDKTSNSQKLFIFKTNTASSYMRDQ